MIMLLLACSCKTKHAGNRQQARLVVKRNTAGNENVLCFRAEFWLKEGTVSQASEIAKLDRDMAGCFYMRSGADTTYPKVAERINDGSTDKMVYLLYFAPHLPGAANERKIEYNGRFLGIQPQAFALERN